MRVRASNPFVQELIRAALLLGKYDLQLNWLGWEAEVDKETIKKALERARGLTWDKPILATRNDTNASGSRGPLTELAVQCLNSEIPFMSVGALLDLALKSLDRLEGCGEEYAAKLAIMKAGYKGKVVADALTVALAYAAFAWDIGVVRVSGPKDFRRFLLIPVELSEDPLKFLQGEIMMQGWKFLPDYANNEKALTLWMAINFDVNGVFRAVYVKRVKNRIDVEMTMPIDLTAERDALQSVFEKRLSEIKTYLKGVLRNVLSDNPDPLAVRFVEVLYQVVHNGMPPEELKIAGLRDYAFLLSTKSEIPPVVRDVAKTALAAKV